MRKRIARAACFFLAFSLGLSPAPAELMGSDLGFFLDPPEGYSLDPDTAVADGKYQFVDVTGKAYLSVFAYDGSRYAKAEAMRDDVKKRLSAQIQGDRLSIRGRDAFFGQASFGQSGQAFKGYVFCLNGAAGGRDFLILSYVDSASFEGYSDFLLSAIDSFSADEGALRFPGPASWSAAPFDGKKGSGARLVYGDASLAFSVGQGWPEASQALIEREARVLAAYGDEPEMMAEAWKRYYRMIYRDSYRRLDEMAFVLGLEIEKRARAAPGSAPREIGNSRLSDREYVEAVLAWVQGFKFSRDLSGSDLLNPLDCALRADGDCDARALLMAILLHHWNVDAGMAVSGVYSHAVGLVGLPGSPGYNAGIEADGKRYLVAETTAKIAPGLIEEGQANPENWIGIGFNF